jgi:hypothetical protein
MHRRRFLRGAALAGSLLVAGCARSGTTSERGRQWHSSRPPEAPPVEPSIDPVTAIADELGLDTIVNLEAEGADATGADPIDDLLAAHATDDTLVHLPPGRYAVSTSFSLGGDARLAIVGDDATIVPPDGFSDPIFALGYPESLRSLTVRGLTFDFTAADTGARPVFANAKDRVHLADIAVRGEIDTNQDQIRIDVTDPAGTGLVERLSLPDGAERGSNVTGCEVGDGNRGDLEFVDCHIEGFTDNGLYADPPEGSVTVDGGFYRNNGIASVRIQSSESSVVRNVHVVCDDGDGGYDNMRGIRLRSGKSLLVEDCVVEMLAVSGSDGAVTFSSELESATVRNCRLRVDADGVNAIRVKSPPKNSGEATTSGPFRCQNILVTGTAGTGAAILASDRNGCQFQNICVHQSGDDRDGLRAENVNGELRDTHLAVTGDPLSLRNSSLERHNVSMTRRPEGRHDCGHHRR